MTSSLKRLLLVPAFVMLAFLAGCGSGVQLEGPGFEALGLTGKKNKVENKVPDRAPLLIPPDRTRLPEPRQSTASVSPQNWPVDAGDVQKAEASKAEKKRKDYEDKGDWSKNADIDEWEKLMDPMERRGGIFSKKALGDENRDFKKYEN